MRVLIRGSWYDYESDYPRGWKFSAGDDYKFPVLINNCPHPCFVKRFDKQATDISGWGLLHQLKGQQDSSPPNLPEIFDIGQQEENGRTVYYVFQACLPGKTLDQVLAERGKINLLQLRDDLLSALDSIHHRVFWFADFCEKNIFCETSGRFSLIDLDSVQPASELPGNEMYGDKEYWSLVLDFYRTILHSNLLSVGSVNRYCLGGIALNYLQLPFLLLRLRNYASSSEYASEQVHQRLTAELNAVDPSVKQLFARILERDDRSLDSGDLFEIQRLTERIIHSSPAILRFTTSKSQVHKSEVFTLSWQVEHTDRIALHRNGVLWAKLEVEQGSITRTEFADSSKAVVYQLKAHQGDTLVESEPVVISLALPVSEPPLIRRFAASKNRVTKWEVFTLDWEVERADRIELHRNGVLGESISLAEGSMNRIEFTDSNQAVSFQLVVYQGSTSVQSEPVVISLEKEHDEPTIKVFTSSKSRVRKSEPFTLSWQVEQADTIELYRNGQLCQPISLGENSTTITELEDNEKEVIYQLIVYKDATPLESALVVIHLEKEGNLSFLLSKLFNRLSKFFGRPYALEPLKRFKIEYVLLLVVIITSIVSLFYLLTTSRRHKDKSTIPVLYTFEPKQIQGAGSIKVFGDNFTSNAVVLFNNVRGTVYRISKNSLSVSIPRLYDHDTTINVVVIINQDTLHSDYQLKYLTIPSIEKSIDTVNVESQSIDSVYSSPVKQHAMAKGKRKTIIQHSTDSSAIIPIDAKQVYRNIRDSITSTYQEKKSGFLHLGRERYILLENNSSHYLDSASVQISYQTNKKLKKEYLVFKSIAPHSKYQQEAPKESHKGDINCLIDSIYFKLP